MTGASVPAHGGLERIAEAGGCSVYRCPGGCLHVQIGATTLRVSAATLGDLSEALAQAHLYVVGAAAGPSN